MKRIVMIAVLMGMAYMASAQDTLPRVYRVPNYYYWDTNWYDWYITHFDHDVSIYSHLYDVPKELHFWNKSHQGMHKRGQMEEARYIYTERPLKIIGIAAVVDVADDFIHFKKHSKTPLTPDSFYYQQIPEYLTLYEVDGDEMIALASGRWDTLKPRFYHPYSGETFAWPGGHSEYLNMFNAYRPTYEVYFDEPVTVRDSFYVAGTMFHNVMITKKDTVDPVIKGFIIDFFNNYETSDPNAYACELYQHIEYLHLVEAAVLRQPKERDNPICKPQPNHYRYRYHSFDLIHTLLPENYYERIPDTGVWHYGTTDYFLHLFPIYDTSRKDTCPAAENLRVIDADYVETILMWNSDPNVSLWELRLLNEGSNDTVVHLYDDTMATFNKLTPLTWYSAWVRGVCNDTNTYEENAVLWGDGVRFFVPDSPTGISTASDDSSVTLTPNPASKNVTISASTKITSIAILSLQGNELCRQTCHDTVCSVELDGLDPGVYMVCVTTTSGGTAYRKLIVR